MTGIGTGEIGGGGPELTEGHLMGTKLVSDANTEEALTASAEKWRRG